MRPPPRWIRPVVATSSVAAMVLLGGAVLAAEAPVGSGASGEAQVVTVAAYGYSPDPVQVTAGGDVRWTWRGEERHSVTADDRSFDSDPDCEDNVLLSGNCRTQGSEDFVWTAPDVTERTEITYHCKLHGASEGMTAKVVVVPAPEPSPSPTSQPSPGASEARSEPEDADTEGSSSSGDGYDGGAPDSDPRLGSAPRLGTQTAPGSSSGSSVASPEVAAPAESDPELEAFPSPASVPSSEDLGSVAVDLPEEGGGSLRTVLLTIATVGVAGTAAAFGSLVLFGPRWR